MNEPRRGRPRNEACRADILAATIELVAEVGIADLTVDAVAKRAGVGKATLYRRWTSKEALMLDAWKSTTTTPFVPDTGSLRGDLTAMFTAWRQPFPDQMMRKVFPQMVAAAKVNDDVHDAYLAFVEERRRPLRTVLDRAVARGELAPDLPLDVVHDLLVAPVMYRWLVTDAPVDEELHATVIELVLAGLHAHSAARA